MKKFILISTILIIGLGLNSFAQTGKKDTVKKTPQATVQQTPAKAQYHLNASRVYHISLDLTESQIFGLTSALEGTLHRNPQLSGGQIGDLEDDNKSFSKVIKSQADSQVNEDFKKWKADTAAVNKKQ